MDHQTYRLKLLEQTYKRLDTLDDKMLDEYLSIIKHGNEADLNDLEGKLRNA